jgi:type IV secretory pathway VirB3-like protein
MARIPYRSKKSNAYQGADRFFNTHLGRVCMVLGLAVFLLLFNYFLNNVWSMLLVILVLMVIGLVQRAIYGPDEKFKESYGQVSSLSKRLRRKDAQSN